MNKCIAILRSGLNKNNPCNRSVKIGEYCGIHKKIQDKIQDNIQIQQNDDIDLLSDNLNMLNVANVVTDNISSINTNHEIYIVQLSEHIRCKDNIYKVGMTTKGINQRIKGYPKNTQILFSISVKNANQCEREVMKKCRVTEGIINCNRNHPDKNKQIGNEYFEAEFTLLKNIVENTCKDFNNAYKVI